jgi:hypothetical protein
MCSSDTGCASVGLLPIRKMARALDIVVAVGHRAVAPGVGDTGDRGRVADARLVVDVVAAPEGGKLAEQIGSFVAELGRA